MTAKYEAYGPVDICEMIGQPYRKHGNYCTTLLQSQRPQAR